MVKVHLQGEEKNGAEVHVEILFGCIGNLAGVGSCVQVEEVIINFLFYYKYVFTFILFL
jgi:hypothetical protein